VKHDRDLHIEAGVVADELWTWANAVTLLRCVVGLTLFSIAAVTHEAVWNVAGLLVYWSLDTLDGFLARRLNQETRLGAQMDILADRLLAAFFYLNFLTTHPGLVVPVVLFLFEFMGFDHYLSNQFMRWPIRSPNYFYEVDPLIWRLNWSPPAKTLNSALVTLTLLVSGSLPLALAVTLTLIGVKLYSIARLHRLPAPR
jgi:CDP-diacylglycerol--glycerol-3-phosphate 3-phosphatidyltransferase